MNDCASCLGLTYSVVSRAHHATVRRHCYAGYANIVLWYELVRTFVLAKIPYAHITPAVTADKLALIGVDDHIVDGNTMGIVPLHIPAPRIPDLDGPILRRSHQPLGFTMKCNARDITSVSIKREDSIWVRRLDIVELDRVVARSGEVALIRRDTEAVDLRVWVRYRPGAYAREGFPETEGWRSVQKTRAKPPGGHKPDRMVVAGYASVSAVCLQRGMWGKRTRTSAQNDRHA
jgi:hypothetical protein